MILIKNELFQTLLGRIAHFLLRIYNYHLKFTLQREYNECRKKNIHVEKMMIIDKKITLKVMYYTGDTINNMSLFKLTKGNVLIILRLNDAIAHIKSLFWCNIM